MTVTRRELGALFIGALADSGCSRMRRETMPLRVGVAPKVTHAAVHLADEKGLFRGEGLEIRFSEFSGEIETLPAIAGGKLDVALMGFSAGLANAVWQGAKMRIVAGRESLKPGCNDLGALYYRRSRFPSGPEHGPDWKGAHIALPTSQNMSAFFLDSVLAFEGVPASSVQISRMPMEDAVAAAAGGHLDVFFGSGRPEFLAGGLPKDIGRSDLLMSALGEFQHTYVLFGSGLLEGDPATGIAFLRAYLRGVRRFVSGETPRYLTELAGRMHLNPEKVKASCRNGVSTTGEVREGDIGKWLAWAVANQQVTRPVTVAQMLDPRFQRAAVASIG